jgi:diketogulonate reductase-like aldo/keto reductase
MEFVDANGARIPIIGLGTWDLRGRVCARIVEQALRMGYRHIDTAQAYDNEREVGEGLRASGIRRSEVFITTKVWWTHFAPRELERSVKDSLARMRLSEADLILLHWPNSAVPLAETLGALCKAKTDGYTRYIGVSNFTVPLLNQAVKLSSEPLVTDQIEYHPYVDQSKVIAACRQHGLAVTAYSPVARGRTQGDELLTLIGKAYGKTAAQVALRWLVQQGIIVIPRTSKIERLSENMNIFDFALTDGQMEQIHSLARPGGRVVNVSWAPKWD